MISFEYFLYLSLTKLTSSKFDQGVSVVQVAANENLKTEDKTSR